MCPEGARHEAVSEAIGLSVRSITDWLVLAANQPIRRRQTAKGGTSFLL